MKTKHYFFATLLAVILTGCYDDDKLWDAVNQQTARIEALESWQKETNSNIQALQTLVSTQDYITQVTPVTLGGDTVGYTIAFKNSKPISIYHGQKGDKGEQGIAGTVPTISATQEADGNWYWTLNGALMKDSSGNPVRANGQTGTAAPTPLLKTGKELTSQGTSGNWISDAAYLSVDNGSSWKKVSGDDGKDGTDGKDGSNGSSGDSMFADVLTSAEEGYVTFFLSNQKEFKVPIYKALTLRFTYKNETLDPNFIVLLDDNTTIIYNIEGTGINKENVKVLPIITSGNSWSVTLDSKAKTLKFNTSSPAEPVTLSITATDNAGQSCSYILNLKKFLGGTGTSENDPFTISTPYELEYLAKQVNERTDDYKGDFIELSNDIDLTGIEWTPIGNYSEKISFKGTFDGNKHTIHGLKVDLKGSAYVGLFGYTKDAILKEITLISPEIKTTGANCGPLVAYIENTTIENCNVTDGICSASGYAGGLIGTAYGKSTIKNCHVKNTTVTGKRYVGGLIGFVKADQKTCDITNCSATGCELNATNGYCAGLIGEFSTTTLNLTACYATGSINFTNNKNTVGALLGVESGDGDVGGTVIMKGCYSTVTDQNGNASFTLQGSQSINGSYTFNACYYITTQPTSPTTGIIYQKEITPQMITEMNAECGDAYDSTDGTLISEPRP